jgi:hypothetical protein
MPHECRPFRVNGKQLWFHLQTDSSNVLFEKRARAACWTSTSDDDEEDASPREAVPGAHLLVELHHHNTVKRQEADGVAFCEVSVMSMPSFQATGKAQLVLPSGEVVNLEAPA